MATKKASSKTALAKASAKAPAKAVDVEVVTEPALDPAWDGVRNSVAILTRAGQAYVFCQAWVGWQLAALKKQNGIKRGQPKKNSAKLAEYLPWAEVVKAQTGLSDRTADRMITLFDAVKAKAKKLATKAKGKASSALSLLETENPLSIPEEQRAELQEIIAKLCDGETQASLMVELGILKLPPGPPKGKKDKDEEDDDAPLSPEQAAFAFFDGPAATLCNLRAKADYEKMLYSLPVVSDDPKKPCLKFLLDEAERFATELKKAYDARMKSGQTK